MSSSSATAKALVLVAALGAWAGCDSCNDKALQTSSTDGGSKSSQLTPEQSAKVLARVGDVTITLGDYVAALEHMDQFDRLRYQSPERRKELLNEMIDVELLAHEATAKGYDKDPIAQQELRAILRDALLKDSRKGLPSAAEIPDDEVRAYYEAHKADYKDPERRRVSLIVLKDEATAKTVLELAKKGSANDWGTLVRDKSVDGQAKANVPTDLAGDFGMVSPPGDTRGDNPRVPDDVRVAVFEIATIGTVLDRVVKAGDKFYVVRFTQRSDAHERSYAEAERSVRVKLAQDKMRTKDEETLTALRTQFPVQIDDKALEQVHVDPVPTVDAGKD